MVLTFQPQDYACSIQASLSLGGEPASGWVYAMDAMETMSSCNPKGALGCRLFLCISLGLVGQQRVANLRNGHSFQKKHAQLGSGRSDSGSRKPWTKQRAKCVDFPLHRLRWDVCKREQMALRCTPLHHDCGTTWHDQEQLALDRGLLGPCIHLLLWLRRL